MNNCNISSTQPQTIIYLDLQIQLEYKDLKCIYHFVPLIDSS